MNEMVLSLGNIRDDIKKAPHSEVALAYGLLAISMSIVYFSNVLSDFIPNEFGKNEKDQASPK